MGGFFSRGEKQNPWIARGEQAFEKQQYADACSHYIRAAELEPQNVDVLVRLANLQRYTGKYADALETYIKITEADTGNRDAWVERALLEGNAGRFENALASLGRITLTGEDTYLKERRCDWLSRVKKYSEAADAVKELADANPENELYHSQYADYLMRSGRYDAALEACTDLISSFPEHAGKYTNDAAFCAEICGDDETALSLYRTLDENDPTGWYRRARLEEINGLFSDAASSYSRVQAHEGKDELQIGLRRINSLFWSGKAKEVGAELERLLAEKTESADLWYMLGTISFISGSMKRAAECFDSCIRFSQDKPDIWNMKAAAEFFSGQYKAAGASFRRAQKLFSGKSTGASLFEGEDDMSLLEDENHPSGKVTFAEDNPELAAIEACCLAALGYTEEADKAALLALSADPARVDMEILHLRLLAAAGKYRETAELSERIEAIAPDDCTILLQHAESEMLLGNFTKAAEIFSELIEEYPDNVMLYSRLMNCIVHTGNDTGAKEAADELLRIMPESAAALQAAADGAYASGDFRKAAEGYEAVLRIQPENISAAVSLGKARMMTGEYAAAKEVFSSAAAEAEENLGIVLHLAKCAAGAGQTEEAAALFSSIAESSPALTGISGELVSIYTSLGKYEEAEAAASAAVAENTADFLHYKLGGDACMKLSRFAEAVPYYIGALGLRAGDEAVTVSLGQAYFRLGEYEEALKAFSEALAENPEDGALLSAKASCEIQLGKYPDAEETLLTLTAGTSENPAALLQLADVLEHLQKYDELLEVCARYAERQPDNVDIIKKAASVYSMRGEYEEALGAYERILELNPDDTMSLRHKAETLASLCRFDEAAEACDALLSTSMDDTDIRLLYGKVLTAAGRYEEAVAQYTVVLKADRENTEALLRYGNLMSCAGEYKKAVVAYEYILRALPENTFISLEKASAAHKLGDLTTMLESMKHAVSTDRKNPHLLSGLGYLAYLTGRPSDALSLFDKAEAAGCCDVDISCIRAQIYLGLNRYDLALDAASAAAEMSPSNALAWHLKAKALEGLGNLPDAVECYQQALAAENSSEGELPFFAGSASGDADGPNEGDGCDETVRAAADAEERDRVGKSEAPGEEKRPAEKPASVRKKSYGQGLSFGDDPDRGKKQRGFIIN